jgi:hypothetical protein
MAKHPEVGEQFQELLQVGLNPPGSFFTTADDVPGVSGTGLIDGQGRVVGVINSANWMDGSNGSKYVPGSTVGVSAAHILEDLKVQVDASDLLSVTSCNN